MRTIIITILILLITTIVYANWGGTRYGGQNFGAGKWGVTAESPGSDQFVFEDRTGFDYIDRTGFNYIDR